MMRMTIRGRNWNHSKAKGIAKLALQSFHIYCLLYSHAPPMGVFRRIRGDWCGAQQRFCGNRRARARRDQGGEDDPRHVDTSNDSSL